MITFSTTISVITQLFLSLSPLTRCLHQIFSTQRASHSLVGMICLEARNEKKLDIRNHSHFESFSEPIIVSLWARDAKLLHHYPYRIAVRSHWDYISWACTHRRLSLKIEQERECTHMRKKHWTESLSFLVPYSRECEFLWARSHKRKLFIL